MDLGIGRSDSSRRVMGKKPTTLDDWKKRCDWCGSGPPADRSSATVSPSR